MLEGSIKTVIVDDEQPSRSALSNYIREFCPGINIVAECGSAKQAFKAILEKQPQLIFLDIEMPMGSGFDLLNMFPEVPFKVIFVTAYSKYAVQAFRISAIDFLLKPVKVIELIEAVNKARQEIHLKNTHLSINVLLDSLARPTDLKTRLVISDSKGFSVVNTSELIVCEADGYCTKFYTTGNRKLSSARNLKYYEDLLPEKMFIRTHHSFIVNINHVTGYTHQEEILLSENLKCPLSAAHKQEFIRIFKKQK